MEFTGWITSNEAQAYKKEWKAFKMVIMCINQSEYWQYKTIALFWWHFIYTRLRWTIIMLNVERR